MENNIRINRESELRLAKEIVYIVIFPHIVAERNLNPIIKRIERLGAFITEMDSLEMDYECIRNVYPEYWERIWRQIENRIGGRMSILLKIVGPIGLGIKIRKIKGFYLPSYSHPASIRGRFTRDLDTGTAFHTVDNLAELKYLREAIGRWLRKKII